MNEAGSTEARRERLALAAILAAAAILPCLFFLGPRTVDHFLTVDYAARIAEGGYRPDDKVQSTRLGILLPLAAVQRVAGINGFSSSLLTILASLVHVGAAFALGRTLFSARAGWAAAGVVALLPFSTIHATLLFPDLIVCALSGAAVALIVRESRRNEIRLAPVLGAGALLGWACLVKQTAIFPGLCLALWILKTRRWTLAWAALPVALAFAAESIALGILTGDPLFRQAGQRQTLLKAVLDWDFSGPDRGWARLVWSFPSMLANPLDKYFPYFAGLPWAAAGAAFYLRNDRPVRLLLAYAGGLLAMIWFWPASLHPYIPALVTDARHLALLILPLALLAGEGFLRIPPRWRPGVAVAYGIVAVTTTALVHGSLAGRDEGVRAAFPVLREAGARKLRAVDPYGHASPLYRYLSGGKPSWEERPYDQESLPEIEGEWIVIDDRASISSREGRPRVLGRDLPIPVRWEQVWSREFRTGFDPRAILLGGAPRSCYRVRVYRVPPRGG